MPALRWLGALAVFAAVVSVSKAPALANGAATAWPQATSDIPAQPDVRFGTLANGMRYAILHNATPTGQAAIRFRIGSGSLEESDAQQGLAHFLEHMAFKGSTHVAEGEMVRILQRKGLAFGPDTNAQTSYDKTLYMLDLPEVDPDTISTGLMLMREAAAELKLDAGAFDRERGVILSEERLRDTPQYRGLMGLLGVLLDGQLVAKRPPIGKTDVIHNAPVGLVQDYYRANYRPERATLMVVGDIDPAAIENEIRQRFSDWKPVGPPAADADLGAVKPQGLKASVVEVPGAGTKVQIGWVRPYDAAPDTVAKRRAQLIEDLGLMVLNRRVTSLARQAEAPFISAEVASQDLYKSAHIALIAADTNPDGWQRALSAAEQEQRRLVRFGVRQDELDREIVEYRSLLQTAADGATTRASTDIAQWLASSVDEDKVFTSPAEDLRLFDEVAKGLTAAEADKALQRVFGCSGPLVVLQTAKAPEGGAAAIEAEFAKSSAVPIAAPAEAHAVIWPYTRFGPSGMVVERSTADDLGLTMVRFANGVRLTVKPTKFSDDEVLVRADIGHGRLDLPRDRFVPTWTAQAFEAAGLKAISYEDMAKALAANVASMDFSIEDGSFRIWGRTRPADLATQLQILTAYTSDPGYRPQAFKRIQQAYLAGLAQYAATPGYVISRDLQGLTHSGDPRWAFPDRDQLLATRPEDFSALFHPALSSGPIDVTVVGNVSVDEAVRLTAGTFGALPQRSDAVVPADALDVRFPQPTAQPVMRTHTGRTDQAGAVAAVSIGDLLSDLPRARAADIAAEVFQNRLLDQFRIAEGATYSPQGEASLSDTLPGFGFAYLYVETTPAKVDRFFELVSKIAVDLQTGDVTPDELARAKEPTIERVRKQQQSNEYWLSNLDGVQTDPRRLELLRTSVSGYEAVTAKDVRTVASAYFDADKFWKFEVLPEVTGAAR
jgi:zinc protease